jgi:hypothetical protein
MLSRRRLIEPAARPGLELPRRLDDWRRADVAPLRGRLAAKLVLLLLLVGTFGAFLFLNRGAVVEPGVHSVFFRVGRPPLLAVLLLTSVVSGAVALLTRAALQTMAQHRCVRTAAQRSPAAGRGAEAQMPVLVATAS